MLCPCGRTSTYTMQPIYTVSELGVFFSLETVVALTCIRCGTERVMSGQGKDVEFYALHSEEGRREIDKARVSEWEGKLEKRNAA